MTPYSITREDAAKDAEAVRLILGTLQGLGVNTSAAVRLTELADSIEEQVKPEEPKEFGSMVRAPWNGRDRLWVRTHKAYWEDESGICAGWTELERPEVLRIGVGAELNSTYGEDPYKTGCADTIDRLQKHLIQLRSSAITVLQQRAYDKAIEAVEAMS